MGQLQTETMGRPGKEVNSRNACSGDNEAGSDGRETIGGYAVMDIGGHCHLVDNTGVRGQRAIEDRILQKVESFNRVEVCVSHHHVKEYIPERKQ